METIENFNIRAYSKKELALRFFPDSTPETAVKHLMALIRRNDMLWDELLSTGYKTTNKESGGQELSYTHYTPINTIYSLRNRYLSVA